MLILLNFYLVENDRREVETLFIPDFYCVMFLKNKQECFIKILTQDTAYRVTKNVRQNKNFEFLERCCIILANILITFPQKIRGQCFN